MAEQAGIEQLRVPVEELLEAGGGPALPVHRDALDPRPGDRLVELGGLAVRVGDLPNRGGDGLGGPIGVVPGEVAPGELYGAGGGRSLAAAEDVVQYLRVFGRP